MQEFFQLIRKLIGLHRADAVEHRLVAGKFGILGIHRRQRAFVEPIEFEREKDQRRGRIRHLLLAIGHEFRPPAIGGQLVIAQARVGHDAPRRGADRLVAANTLQETGRVERGQFALVIGGEIGAGLVQPVEIAREFGRGLGGVEIAQVPFRQLSQVLVARAGIGIADGKRQVEHGGTSC